jgi:Anti-sigma factor NepR
MKDRKSSTRGAKVRNPSSAPETANLGRDVQAKIGQQLRSMYAGVVDQGVPDRFVELLKKLDEAGGSRDKAGESE